MLDKKLIAEQILDLLREVELLVAELYRRFAQAFPLDRAIWEDLGRDEESHAGMVAELKAILFKNNFPAGFGKVNLAILGTYRKGLQDHIIRIQNGELGRQNALFIARDLEKTLVERAFYESVKSDDPEYRALQSRIQRETGTHLRRLEEYISRI
jgi:hypothetical protein